MKARIKCSPFLLCGLYGLLVQRLIMSYGFQYDDVGLRGLIFWVGQVCYFPFWIFEELLFAINAGKAGQWHHLVAVVLGLLLCCILDSALFSVLKRRRRAGGLS